MVKDDIKNKLLAAKEYLLKNYKIAFPVAIMLAVAVMVSIALGASGDRKAFFDIGALSRRRYLWRKMMTRRSGS